MFVITTFDENKNDCILEIKIDGVDISIPLDI